MPYSASAYARALSLHRESLTALLERVPDEQGDFSAWEGGMSFQHLTDHLAISSERALAILGGKSMDKPDPAEDFAAARARLVATTAPMRSSLAPLSEAALAGSVDAFGRSMPLYVFIDVMREHEAHHKGQLWTMARMIGLEPPLFIALS